jgi:hypothetical protein
MHEFRGADREQGGQRRDACRRVRGLRTQRYMKEGEVWAKMERKEKVEGGYLILFPSHNSGRNSQVPISQARTRRGAGVCRNDGCPLSPKLRYSFGSQDIK